MYNHSLIVFASILLGVLKVHSQSHFSYAAYVLDSLTKEPLIGANIYAVNAQYGVQTNEYGYFSIQLSNKDSLSISYVGYTSYKVPIEENRSETAQILLSPQSDLPTVEVIANEQNSQLGSEVNPLSLKELKMIPPLLGEVDVIRALSLTPGVSIGAEGTTGLFVRGGTSDQNLILLDGATVYNPAHLFGFLSVFNADAINNIRLLKTGFPAEYGGRLSSILEVNMKEGNKKQSRKKANTGIISSSFLWEGPLQLDKSSFMLSARTSYLSLLALPVKILYDSRQRNHYSNYWLYDLNGKINFKLSKKDQLFISFYGGQDDYDDFARFEGNVSQQELNWGNQTASIRYVRQLSPKLFSKTILSYNRYRYRQSGVTTRDSSSIVQSSILNTSGIRDFSLKSDLNWSINGGHQIKTGVNVTAHKFTPGILETEFGLDTLSQIQLDTQPLSSSAYVSGDINILPKLKSVIGLRYLNYLIDETTYHYLEPRLTINFSASQSQQWSYSFTRMSQPIHLLTTENSLGLPNNIWYPATENVAPQSALQHSLSFEQKIIPWNLKMVVSGYHKSLTNQIDFREGINLNNNTSDWESLLETGGIGESYGAEFFIHKTKGKWNGWLSYTLSWNNRKFTSLNQGRWYPHRYDRRQDIALVGIYQLDEKWNFAANFVFNTGNAITLPTSFYLPIQSNRHSTPVPIFTERNNERLPAYHRLDLSANRTQTNKKGRENTLSISVYNVYSRRNINYITNNGVVGIQDGQVVPNTLNFSYRGHSLFPIIPSISYQISL